MPVTAVEELTGFPECLDGRVKTLHPRVHAGLLADLGNPDHVAQLAELGIEPFELVVSNLYPFRDTVRSGASPDECVEQIDIGGPSMVRAAAKNHATVAVVVSPDRYAEVLEAVAAGGFTLAQRQRLAAEAFAHTASYDVAVASWMGIGAGAARRRLVVPGLDRCDLGEARRPALRREPAPAGGALRATGGPGVAQAELLHGKEMSYNNYVDADAAGRAAFDFDRAGGRDHQARQPVRHRGRRSTSPTPTRRRTPATRSRRTAASSRPTAPVTLAMAEQLAEIFTEVVAAPSFDDDAFELLSEPQEPSGCSSCPSSRRRIPSSSGRSRAACWCRRSTGSMPSSRPGRAPRPAATTRRAGAWPAGRPRTRPRWPTWPSPGRRSARCGPTRSCSPTTARASASAWARSTGSTRASSPSTRAGADRARGSVAASDAFFPFADGPEVLIDAGVRAIVQPGGSIRDDDVIAAAEAAGVTMYFTGTRHFFH